MVCRVQGRFVHGWTENVKEDRQIERGGNMTTRGWFSPIGHWVSVKCSVEGKSLSGAQNERHFVGGSLQMSACCWCWRMLAARWVALELKRHSIISKLASNKYFDTYSDTYTIEYGSINTGMIMDTLTQPQTDRRTHRHTHTHTHTFTRICNIYIYIYIHMCVCVCLHYRTGKSR